MPDDLDDLEFRVTRDITPAAARESASASGEIVTSSHAPAAAPRQLAHTRRLDTAQVTLAARESFMRSLRLAIGEAGHAMCDPGMNNAQRVAVAAFVDSALNVLAFL